MAFNTDQELVGSTLLVPEELSFEDAPGASPSARELTVAAAAAPGLAAERPMSPGRM